MADFIDAAIVSDPAQLADDAIDQLTATLSVNGFPGYIPNEGNLEIILIGVIAAMAADAATVASQMPSAAFRALGTKLFGVQYNQGAAATVASTWTLADTAGHTIDGGTYVTIGALGFYVTADVTVASTFDTATVLLTAVAAGSLYNGLTGTVVPVDEIDWVASIVTIGSTSGGADAEDDADYQTRLATELALQAPRPITAADYAAMAITAPSSILPGGVVVGRATSIDGYDPSVNSFTANRTSASATLASVSSFTGVTAGTQITGTGIPANTTVLSVNPGASTLVMSANASSGSATSTTITATGSYGNPRTNTTFVTDPEGVALSSPAMTAIATWLAGYRELNFVVYVIAPTYTPIYVTCQVHCLPGYDPTAVIANVQGAILGYLNQATWGAPASTTGPNQWLNLVQGFNIVRFNKLLGIVENVPGVDYVPTGQLTLGTTASPAGVVDITLPGPAPLPQADLTTPTIVVTSV